MWIGTLGGLARLEPAANEGAKPSFTRFRHDPSSPASLSDDSVRSILEDRSGTLWIGTFGGLNRFGGTAGGLEPGTFEHFRHRAGDPVSLSEDRTRVIYEDREGRLWIGTDGGLNLFDPAAVTFDRYRHDPADARSLSNDRVSAIYQDRGGVLWIGTQGGGINKWDPRAWSFSSVSVRPDLSGRDVLAFAEDAEGRLWIGTSGFGLNRVDHETGQVDQFRHRSADPTSLGDDRVLAITHDRRGVLWIGTMAGGPNRFEAASETFVRFRHRPEDPKSRGSNTVASILEDHRGALWLGTFGGLNLFEQESSTFTRFPHDPDNSASLSDNRIIALAEDRQGMLWIGTMGGGLNLLDRRTGTSSVFAEIRPTRKACRMTP